MRTRSAVVTGTLEPADEVGDGDRNAGATRTRSAAIEVAAVADHLSTTETIPRQPVVFALPWPALGAIASGLIAVGFLGYLWPHRKQPGATLFMAMIGTVILWTGSYGVALVTFEPTLRFLLEIPIACIFSVNSAS